MVLSCALRVFPRYLGFLPRQTLKAHTDRTRFGNATRIFSFQKQIKASTDKIFTRYADQSPVYTTVILGTARLNFGTRTHFFGHGTPNFCRVNAKLRVRGPKILSGPRPPQEVVSARIKMGPRTKNLLRTHFVSHIAKILCFYKQNIEGKCGQTKPYTRAPIYIMRVMHMKKLYIQQVFLLHSSQSPQQSEEPAANHCCSINFQRNKTEYLNI